jgi:hypothetical protein
MPLSFAPVAADRWRSLAASTGDYERAVRAAITPILGHLDAHPELHRIGASQFRTMPTTWARTVDVGEGASWMVVWTTGETAGEIRILRIEPAPSMS